MNTQLSIGEIVKLSAVDTEFYGQTFFPNTFRQKSPTFARLVWDELENPNVRLLNLVLFRGAAKTTRLRVFASKRIAFGLSRTILYIGASEPDAIRSVQWLRSNVEKNDLWRDTFGLRPGRKWEERQIEIIHPLLKNPDGSPQSIWVLGSGITGSLRGINFDDYRPDLIVVDDPQTDEMAASETQRSKTEDLILGAVKNSLAPEVDEPNAKLVSAATPQHKEDVTQKAIIDPEWKSIVIGCWTQETQELDVDQQESSWPEREPTDKLRADKKAHIQRNKLSVFMREKECRLTSPEAVAFRAPWLNIRQPGIGPPAGLRTVLSIDPVPPPSAQQITRGLQGKDEEVHQVWGQRGDEYHLCASMASKGHEPSWSIATAFGLARQWRVGKIIVESVAYQRVLKWLIEQEMRRRGIYYIIIPYVDTRGKFARIESTVGSLASHGKLWVGLEHTRFISQFEQFGPLYTGLDDELDAAAIALSELANPFLEIEGAAGSDTDVEDFPFVGACP